MSETPEQSTDGPASAPDNDFGKVISDFVKDLLNTFPEIATSKEGSIRRPEQSWINFVFHR